MQTKVTGFPGPTVTITTGDKWTVKAKVTGPIGRTVYLQRKSGHRWLAEAKSHTVRGGRVVFGVWNPPAGGHRMKVPAAGKYKAKTTGVQVVHKRLATKVTGFPGPRAALAPGATWTPTATIGGPIGRIVVLERLSGSKWIQAAVSKTGAGGVVKFKVKVTASGQYRLRIPVSGNYGAKISGVQTITQATVKPFKMVPRKLVGTFSGGDFQASWSGQATLVEDTTVGREDNNSVFRVESITGSWWANNKTSAPTCVDSGGGSFTTKDLGVSAEVTNWWGDTGPFTPVPWSLWLEVDAVPPYQMMITTTCEGSQPMTVDVAAFGYPLLWQHDSQGPFSVDGGKTFVGHDPGADGVPFDWYFTGSEYVARTR